MTPAASVPTFAKAQRWATRPDQGADRTRSGQESARGNTSGSAAKEKNILRDSPRPELTSRRAKKRQRRDSASWSTGGHRKIHQAAPRTTPSAIPKMIHSALSSGMRSQSFSPLIAETQAYVVALATW